MTVTVDLTPELEQRLATQAMAQGLPVEAHLLSAIEPAAAPAASERASLERFEEEMDELAEGLNGALNCRLFGGLA